MTMLLYLAHKIHECGDIQQFFRSAYMFKFGKDHDCTNDIVQYKLHAIIPPYISDFVAHIQKNE